MLAEGWRDQYDRMIRSYDQLLQVSAGTTSGSPFARDTLYHFFQDAYHLKDWLKHDPESGVADDVETFINTAKVLQVCGDLCNGTKHLTLDRSRTDEKNLVGVEAIAFASQSPTVDMGTGTVPHQWTVDSKGVVQIESVSELAGAVIEAWDVWLRDVKEIL